jgi:hypothetical protein
MAVTAWIAAMTWAAGAEEHEWRRAMLGVCEDYPEETRRIEQARADLRATHDAGAQVLRIAFGWDAMEPERGRFDWSFWDEFVRAATHDFGLRLIPYVCYTPKWAARDNGENFWRSPPRDPEDFARFVAALVGHYRADIHSWELWNEPDNPAYWLGNREEFAAVVRAGSRAVRRVDPTAAVVLGGIATDLSFLDGLFRVDHIAPAVDVVNVHSYFETWHPDPIESLPTYVARVASIVHELGENEPIWMAETGYSSVGAREKVSDVYRARVRGEHTDAAQAGALARTVILGLSTGELSLIAWYRINDLPTAEEVIGDDNNRHLGLRAVDGTAKPVWSTFARLAGWFAQPYRLEHAEVSVGAAGPEPVEVRTFALRDGRHVAATWIALPRGARPSAGEGSTPSDRRHATMRIRLPQVTARDVRVTDAVGVTMPASRAVRRTADRAEVELSLEGGDVLLCEFVP